MTRWFLTILLLLFVMVVYSVMVFVTGIKPGHYPSTKTPADYGLKYEEITAVTDDGLGIAEWFVPNPDSRAVIIIGHGYPYDKGNILGKTVFLSKFFNLLYFDFRYFGESEGRYTTFGIKEQLDIIAVLEQLNKRTDIDQTRIGLYGFSLSAASFILANPKQAKAMVLDSPYNSMQSMIANSFKWLGPFKWPFVQLIKIYCHVFLGIEIDRASALAVVDQLTMPVFFIHGKEDKMIPARHSLELHQKCSSPNKLLWIMENAGHNQRPELIRSQYEEKIIGFFSKWLNNDLKE